MNRQLEALVRRRAGRRCEYCHLPQEISTIQFEIDHILPKKHGGKTSGANLALSCFYCNTFKGPNLAGIDPHTKEKIVRLFHPRRHQWAFHFVWNGPWLKGNTAIGRTTIEVLQINHPDAVNARQALIEEGIFP